MKFGPHENFLLYVIHTASDRSWAWRPGERVHWFVRLHHPGVSHTQEIELREHFIMTRLN